ncbi:MAG TPA: tripartite tricarboxylate transporter substrate-binding protein [Pseudolabrys sp.]|nr:tripartite tricarboxylate transporter substrate-binding protein [Pseudolabrys sp.]
MKKIVAAIVCALAMMSVQASTQKYPSRPITLIVPFGAGGPTDTIARILAERMKVSLGQPVIVENVGGAAGSIGVGRVAAATPDGYTLSIGHWGTHAVNSLVYKLHYDLLRDLQPIALVASNPYLILSTNAVPAHDLKGLITWLKSDKTKATSATNGVGSAGYLIGSQFKRATGTTFQFVAYRGGVGASMTDLIGGHIDLMFDQLATSLPQVRAGRIRAYAVTAKKRLAVAPDIPTVDEAGLPEFYMSAWHGLWVPKGTPKAIVAKLNAAVVDALADPAVRKRLTNLGQQIPPRDQQTPKALAAQQRAEIAKWKPILKAEEPASH